jgi:UDP-N-acetylmuramoyl-L-alanyl-D-glutamate--2,6-diaminopimelate ligase
MLLQELLRSAGIYYRACGDENITIDSISSDSRSAGENSLFVCIRGRIHDGHSHVKEAITQGAIAVIAEDELRDLPSGVTVIYTQDTRSALACLYNAYYGHPARDMKLIAITGTNGKTSVSFMLDAVFSAALSKCGLIGTVYCRTPKRLLELDKGDLTTPEPAVLYRALAEMKRDGAEYVFIEASSHALSMGRLAPLNFAAAVFTNLTPEHMDFHSDMESYFLAKASLLEKCDRAYINLDDLYASRYRAYARAMGCNAKLLYYSGAGKQEADFRADKVKLCGVNGISYTYLSKNTVCEIRSPIPGRFTVDNTLATAAVAFGFGISAGCVSEAIASFGGAPGRLKRVKLATGYAASVYVDYAHTPDALENILTAAKSFLPKSSRLILVFGCGGDRDKLKRPLMGKIATSIADVTIITSDNSRSELPEDIISDIISGIDVESKHAVIVARVDAIKYAVRIARDGDVIFLCGKGHEKYEIGIGGRRDFDESSIVKSTVLEMLAGKDEKKDELL